MDSDAIDVLERGSYMSFATRKKSGEFVATPVWFAPEGGSYYVFSAGDAGKVKRLRNFSESRIAPCTVSGRVTGDWIDTRAYLLDDPSEQATALRALRRKYSWQMAIGDIFSTLTGKMGRRAYIRVDVEGS
jgi:PPOX class probable F420-dependent enzyme